MNQTIKPVTKKEKTKKDKKDKKKTWLKTFYQKRFFFLQNNTNDKRQSQSLVFQLRAFPNELVCDKTIICNV